MVDTKVEQFYVKHKKYAITLNPKDKFQFFGRKDRFHRFRNLMYEELLTFPGKYELYIEISEPRGMHTAGYAGPRLHLHGWIEFSSVTTLEQFLLLFYYKLLRFTSVDIDTIDDIDKWLLYCKKQKIFKRNRLSSFALHIKP